MRIPPTLAAAGLAVAVLASACTNSSNSSAPTVSTSDTVPATAGSATTPAAATTGATAATSAATAATAATEPSTTTPPTAASTTTQAGAVDPNAPEVVEPGDIPDNQVFIPFTSPDGLYTVKVPEGWARTEAGGVVTFTDKYNSIMLASSPSATPPSVESVTSEGLSDVASDPTFTLIDVSPVTRKAGTGVLAKYEIGSAPNAVTGKKALLAVERYVFSHNGTAVTMTLSGAKGADNVDPWKIVSDSLAWK
jgi:hypothetical protein